MLSGFAIAWCVGFAWFAEDMPREPASQDTSADGIVVLTGGASRLRAGLDLLAAGRGRKLFVSGVYRGVDVSELLRVARQRPDAVECCIVLGHEADNTRGNAIETRDWAGREGFASLVVVTANYHMRRALLEFRRAMPEMRLVPHAVAPEAFRRSDWWQWPGTLSLIAIEYTKYLVALARPFLPERIGIDLS
ncbi:MAG: YdcF family protein [Alphaproteobacteria bacterium]|nr:YdcF family protein [Alphaproteobacteria bacterium]